MEKKSLLCIGSAITDCIIKGFNPQPVSSYGFTASSCSLSAGGEAVNESIITSKLGLSPDILCFLGKGGGGDIIYKKLSDSGVGMKHIIFEEDHPTPVTTIFLDESGNRKSITNEAHKYNFHPERYIGLFEEYKAISLGSLFRAPFNDPQIILRCVKAAKESGAIVFADTKLPNFVRLTLEDIKDSLPYIDYIFPNEDESKYYTGESEPEKMADVFLSYGIKNAVIKLGDKGCYFKNSKEEYFLPACKVNAIDATGAGDSFIAGFICEYLNGKSNLDCLKFGNACGAVCTSAVGTTAGIVSKEQVAGFFCNS